MIATGETRLAGVVGWPVSHSRSPRLHGYWLEHYAIDGAYLPLGVDPRHVETALRALPLLGFRGVNVTVPHKEEALGVVDRVDDMAARIGAVNTIVIDAQGRLEGRNSDGFGFMENLRHGAPGFDASRGAAVVLGAGGAARAVVAALLEAGTPELRLINRTRERAEKLAGDMGGAVRVENWQDRDQVLQDAALLVNTTTLGLTGHAPLDLNLDRLPGEAVVNDIVYLPLRTPLLDDAARRGNPVVDGLGMLLHQARPGFEAWFGRDPEVTQELRDFVAADLE